MSQPRHTLYYDGACGMCQRSVRVFQRLDWLNRLTYQDSTALPDDQLPTARDTTLEGIPMRTRDGRVLVGFSAVRRALLQTPLGFIPALLLYLPGVSHVGRHVYNRIAAQRQRSAACDVSMHPPD